MNAPFRYGSVCSGIEAATVAWHPLGWRASFFSEIEAFPRVVLAHHYPETPLHGDFTTIRAGDYAPIDLLVGGTPCQSFSIAGLRKGLDDPRGNLMLGYGSLADRLRPRWLVWENVPGVLSSDGGRDFGTFLGMLGLLGYGFAYRVLDAQYFGVPQRRRRVFVVGCFGDWRAAAAVLFERHSLSGHPAPRRETREGSAAGTLRGTDGGSCVDHARAGHLVAGALTARYGRNGGAANDDVLQGRVLAFGGNNTSGPIDVATACRAKGGSGHGDFESETFIAHTLRGEGFDASEGGTGRGTPLVPVAFDSRQECVSSTEVFGALGSSSPQAQAVAFQPRIGRNGRGYAEDVFPALNGADAGATSDMRPCVAMPSAVRRLTPRECERLQGFPDDYTRIPLRNKKSGKPNGKCAKDGPRYKALGNSMAVPVMCWIGERIQAVDALLAMRGAA